MLVYFEKFSKGLKASTLWSHYSMIESHCKYKTLVFLNMRDLRHIKKEKKMKPTLQKKSKTFFSEEVHNFFYQSK